MRLPLHLMAAWVVAAICALGAVAPAQIPDGWYVTSSFQWPTGLPEAPGPAGLYVGHPTIPRAGMPISGLPAAITTCTSTSHGTDFVLRRPSDGALITDSFCLSVPSPVQLHVLAVSGSPAAGFTASTIQTIPLGTLTSIADYGVPQVALLPDQRTLVLAVDRLGLPGEPLFGAVLGTVDLTLGTVAPIAVSPIPPGQANAVAVDPVRRVAYLGMDALSAGVYSVPLQGGTPTLLANIPRPSGRGGIGNLALDNNGDLIASGWGLFRISLTAGPPYPVTQIATPLARVDSVVVERATGDYLVSGSMNWPGVYGVYRVSPTGVTTQIGSPPAGGWGVLAGIDLDPNPESYGAASGPLTSANWLLAPNPAGLPTVGHTGFGLQLEIAPTPIASAVLLGVQEANPPLLIPGGTAQLLVFPAPVLANWPVPSGPVINVQLPIPALPALRGGELYLQTVHVDAAFRLAGSPGVHWTIL